MSTDIAKLLTGEYNMSNSTTELYGQIAALKTEAINVEISNVVLSRFKKVSLSIVDSIYPMVNPHERKVLLIATELKRSRDAVTSIIERFNETQKVNVAAYNKAKVNPDLWNDDPKICIAAQEVVRALNMLVIPQLPSELVEEIAKEREHQVKVTSNLASEIRLQDDWDNANANLEDYDKGFELPSLEDSKAAMVKFAQSVTAGEYPITDVVDSTGLTFSQVKELVEIMVYDGSRVYGNTTLMLTHVLVL